jgi:serine/threonine protein kinase/tetratricopeptide (TPR) repeat protein
MGTEQRGVKAIFDEAAEIGDREARAAYLDQACAGDLELRRKVELLLQAYADAGSFMERPAVEVAIAHTPDRADPTPGHPPRPIAEGPGTRIGPYKLLQQIGEGGMGVVYMAEQERPVRRKVALKIIKPGMDSAQVIARFEAERQALALMDHQNIARVWDAGTTDSGRPYFVMELVDGVPITKYCDDTHLTPRERLDLFVPVCQAIQHAHQKGVIHRDIKPSNVLVTLYDGKPVPKVIDFGVAKAIDQRLTERTMFTHHGSVVGTLEYMSPEQAEMSALGVDTRSDIYALGVLLYELLTGSTPLERASLRDAGYNEILRRIKEEDPPKPSTRLSDSRERLASISSQRHTEPARLTKLLRGELDWIVMKALEKDRTRRYATANGFARDIERYLAGDPVEAGPPSATYKLRKLARKHRAALATTAAFMALLLLSAAISISLAAQAVRSEATARQQAASAELARQSEARLRRTADDDQQRARTAEQAARDEEAKTKKSESETRTVLEFFRDKVLAAGRPKGQDGGLGKTATIREAVDAAVPGIEKSFAGQPTVEASIRDTLGQSYLYLSEPALAIRHHEHALELRRRALGPDHPDTLTSMSSLATAYWAAGRLDDAMRLHKEALERRRATLGRDHADTLESMGSLAVAYQDAGRSADALPLFEETLKRQQATLGPEHPDVLTSMNNLATAYEDDRQLGKAVPLFEETLKRRRATLSPDHPHTLISMSNLARAYREAGRLADALPLHEETLKRQKATLGADHTDTLVSMNDLALAYRDQGRLDQAVPIFEETLKRRQATTGPDHLETLKSMNNLALAYRGSGRLPDALALYEDTLKKTTAKLGRDHSLTLSVMNNLGAAYQAAGRPTDALPLFEAVLKGRHATLGPDHPDTLVSNTILARAYLRDKPAQAESLLRQALAVLDKKSPDDWQTFETRSLLGASLLEQKKYAEAEPFVVDSYVAMKVLEPKVPPRFRKRLPEVGKRIVTLYTAWGKQDKVLEWTKKLEISR